MAMFMIGCPDCGCSPPADVCVTFEVFHCGAQGGFQPSGGSIVPAGVACRLKTPGGVIVAEGTTNSLGRVTLCVETAGTYRFEVDAFPFFDTYGASAALANGQTRRFVVPSSALSPLYCCATANFCSTTWKVRAKDLYITDAYGTWPARPGGIACGTLTFDAVANLPNVLVVDDPVAGTCKVASSPYPYYYTATLAGGGCGATSASVTRRTKTGTFPRPPAPGGVQYPAVSCASEIGQSGCLTRDPGVLCPDLYLSGTLSGTYDPIGGTVILSN